MSAESLDNFTNSVQPEVDEVEPTNERRSALFDAIRDYSSEQDNLNWEGSFGDYVEKVSESPNIARGARKYVYDAVTAKPDYFTSGPYALFGAEKMIDQYLHFLYAGAEGLPIGNRLLMIVGPPGSGKSTLLSATKRAIEDYSTTDEGAMYAIKGCPMQEEPLHLIPKKLRGKFEEDYGVHIEGDLCPQCEWNYGGSNFDVDKIQNAPVERLILSEKQRKGIGTFEPSDPKNQEITELVGTPDISKLGEYGSAKDPRAYRFDGELNKANRGLLELPEFLKVDPRFHFVMLNFIQDRLFKTPGFASIYADEVAISHTNLSEYREYMGNDKNEAMRDRTIVVDGNYSLKVSEEAKIHQKLIEQSEKAKLSRAHINPLALQTAANFAVLSRLKPSERVFDKMEKLKIYDGRDTDDLTQRDINELKEESPEEGTFGVSPRFVIDSLSLALADKDRKCLTPIDAINALRDNLNVHGDTRNKPDSEKAALKEDLQAIHDEYDKIAGREVQKAFVFAFEDNAKSLCDNYLENVMAYCDNAKVVNSVTDEELEPNEDLMRSIEEQVRVSENGKDEFRHELERKMLAVYRKGETFDYTSYPRLKEAIEKKLFSQMKDVIKLTLSAKVPNEKQQKRLSEIEQTLINERGYCEHCARGLIEYYGGKLNGKSS